MKVVLSHVSAWPEVRRGAERYVHELAGALLQLGHDVRLITSGPSSTRTTVLGVPVTVVGRGALDPLLRATGRQQTRFAARALADVLPRGADVWHANSLYDGAAAVVAGRVRPGLRSVFTFHGPAVPAQLATAPRRQAFALARRSDARISVSGRAADDLVRDVGISSTVVPPGVDASAFTPGPSRAPVPVVLYVGSLTSRRKNLALLLQGAERALADEPRLQVWLVGQGDPRPAIATAPGASDAVKVLGPLEGDALRNAYRSAWLTALVSEREVFGMTVVESLACGTPALVLDDGWGPASIVTDGTGVRAAATAERVGTSIVAGLALSADPGTSARCRAAAEEYDWRTRIAPRLLEVYASHG